MIKLNTTIYNKLLLQAEEAKYKGMTKIASGIVDAIGSSPEYDKVTYSTVELDEDIYRGLWKLAACILKYHDTSSVNVEQLDEVIESMAAKFVDEIELSLEIGGSRIGAIEPILPGESK